MFLWKGHFWAKWFSVYLAVAERKNISTVYFLSLEDGEEKLCWIGKHMTLWCLNIFESLFISGCVGADWKLALKYLTWKLFWICFSMHLSRFTWRVTHRNRSLSSLSNFIIMVVLLIVLIMVIIYQMSLMCPSGEFWCPSGLPISPYLHWFSG